MRDAGRPGSRTAHEWMRWPSRSTCSVTAWGQRRPRRIAGTQRTGRDADCQLPGPRGGAPTVRWRTCGSPSTCPIRRSTPTSREPLIGCPRWPRPCRRAGACRSGRRTPRAPTCSVRLAFGSPPIGSFPRIGVGTRRVGARGGARRPAVVNARRVGQREPRASRQAPGSSTPARAALTRPPTMKG